MILTDPLDLADVIGVPADHCLEEEILRRLNGYDHPNIVQLLYVYHQQYPDNRVSHQCSRDSVLTITHLVF